MKLHLHNGRIYILYFTLVWLDYLRPTGTAEASGKSLLCAVHAQPHGLAGVSFLLDMATQEQSLAGGHLHRGGAVCAHTNQPFGLLQIAGRATASSRDCRQLLDLSTAV